MATRVVDSDAHVIEGQELMAELLARFPDKIRMARPDEEGAALVIEGRRYPNASGPGAGCHAKHGLCLDRGASPFTAEGVMRDADREGIDAMVFFPSPALGLPAFTDLAFAAECARLYNRWLAGYCRQFPQRMFGVGLVPIEDVAPSIRIMRQARELVLVTLMVPVVLRTPECKREPREYLARGQLYVSCEPEESALPFVARGLGAHFVMYASDYPHWDSDFPNSTRGLRERTDLAPEVKAQIMGENAAAFYRLPA